MCIICAGKGPNPTRRNMIFSSAAILATATAGRRAQAQTATTPEATLDLLVQGNARYAANQPRERDFSAGRAARAEGQAPFAAILGCADSRVAPELLFDLGPGDLFVARVAGNFVTPAVLASLEYGNAVLGARLIMVLGHSNCGAVNAAISALQKGNTFPGHISDLVRALKPGILSAVQHPGNDLKDRAVVANVRYNVQRLQNAHPILAEAVAKKTLLVVGGVYDLATGKVTLV
jgi:carbonic anhydrase